ncbi:hypothetical protein HQ524_04695 [Candidatus Uhrbacteria bacterium]|nr:hypothetical protein [Candidatus Uhrbacteria bacterium]
MSEFNRGPVGLEADGTVRFFVNRGVDQEETWVVFQGRERATAVPSALIGEGIDNVIGRDIKKGLGDQIDHVLVSPAVAVYLYLEGRITADSLRHADIVHGQVVIRGVRFKFVEDDSEEDATRLFHVVVHPYYTQGFATINANGMMV